jgi:hypothetical protein
MVEKISQELFTVVYVLDVIIAVTSSSYSTRLFLKLQGRVK